jgi:sulfur carrier protein
MDIFVNNQKKQMPSGATIHALLENMNIDNKTGLAVAVNKKIISKQNWNTAQLKENDKVLLIQASQGG